MFLEILKYVLLFVEIVSALLLIIVILMQRSKGQGVGVAFGGGMGEAVFGSQMGNVLTKVTVVLTFIFLLNTTALAIFGSRQKVTSVTDAMLQLPPVSSSSPGASSLETAVLPQDESAQVPNYGMDGFSESNPDD